MSLATSIPLSSTQFAAANITRPLVDYSPDIWEDTFLRYDPESLELNDHVKQQAQMLKEEVKKMFQSSINQSIIQKLNFIDLLQRFSVSYHFKQEINHTLGQIYETFKNNNIIGDDDDHHSLALLFRLLKQQGYKISSDVFKKLKNEQGNFNETLANNIQGLCDLYEVAHLRANEDDILEEVYDFSNTRLKSLASQLGSSLATKINYCLRRPINKSVPRFDARYHMTIYEENVFHDETLLVFAKVDFNILQKLHHKEISSISKWWKNSNFETKVPYARQRLVESYIWSLSMSYEPEYSIARMFLGKVIGVVCLLDDTYDAYGTIQELELFTEAIQRWNISPIEALPHCMQVVFNAVLELCDEIESTTTGSGQPSFVVPRFKQAVFNQIKGYMVEAKWCHEGYIPSYDEYKNNGILTSCYPLFITTFVGLGEYATKDVLNWIFSNPKIIEAVSVMGRVMDDMATHKFEQQRVHVATAVECCMNQYGISQEEAYKLILNDVEECWKVINEECAKLNDIPKSVLECIVNLARMSVLAYENYQDRYTHGELIKDLVSSLLLDPMPLPASV